MKAVLIILGIVTITFATIVIWGVSREKDAGAGGIFGKPPPVSANGEPDEDSLADWRPPPIGEALGPVLAPFGTPVDVSREQIDLLAQGEARVTVGRSDEEFQAARLSMPSQGAVRAWSVPMDDEPEAATVCLCREDALVDTALFDGCGVRWRLDRARSDGRYRCLRGDDRATLVFGPRGGTLRFAAGRSSAQVSIR